MPYDFDIRWAIKWGGFPRLTQRNIDLYDRYMGGETQKSLAREYGISAGRVSAIFLQMQDRLKGAHCGMNIIWTPERQHEETSVQRGIWREG